MAAPNSSPARFVNPVGTALRSLLGSRDRGFEWRVVSALQVVTVVVALKSGVAVAAITLLLDGLLVTALVRHRDAVRAWRGRVWAFSERAWWL